MVKKSVYVFAGLATFLLVALYLSTLSPSVGSTSQSSGLNYKGYVCVYKNGVLVDCNHNVLFDNGRNITRDALGAAGNGTVLNISICNGSNTCGTPVAAGSEAFNSYLGNCSMNSTMGTYRVIGGSVPGNWTVTNVFTSSCDNINMSVTRLTNVTGGIFAGNTFTLVTLQTNDQLTINWTLMVS